MASRDTRARTATPDDQNPGRYYSVGTTPSDKANIDNYAGSPAEAMTPRTGNGMMDAMHSLADKLHPTGN